jgi:hypothetical protein
VNADGTTYNLEGTNYPYRAPGLNAAPGNVAGDPTWNPALLAVAARSDMDNAGIALRAPMPDWLSRTSATSRQPPTTQDFADIFAYLATQTK